MSRSETKRFTLEALEPRLLLSADPAALAVAEQSSNLDLAADSYAQAEVLSLGFAQNQAASRDDFAGYVPDQSNNLFDGLSAEDLELESGLAGPAGEEIESPAAISDPVFEFVFTPDEDHLSASTDQGSAGDSDATESHLTIPLMAASRDDFSGEESIIETLESTVHAAPNLISGGTIDKGGSLALSAADSLQSEPGPPVISTVRIELEPIEMARLEDGFGKLMMAQLAISEAPVIDAPTLVYGREDSSIIFGLNHPAVGEDTSIWIRHPEQWDNDLTPGSEWMASLVATNGTIALRDSGTGFWQNPVEELTLSGGLLDINLALINLLFMPDPDFFGEAGLQIFVDDQSGLNEPASHFITMVILPVPDIPLVSHATTLEDTQSTNGLVITRHEVDGPEVTQFLIVTVEGGALFKNDGTTVLEPGAFITIEEGAAGLKFTPDRDVVGFGNIQVAAALEDNTVGHPNLFGRIWIVPVNDPPEFTKGPDITVDKNSGPQSIAGWATAISPGPPDESGQAVTFTVTSDNEALFAASPALTPEGTLTFTPAFNAHGSAVVTVVLKDDGGTENGGLDASAPQTFTITVTDVNFAPIFTNAPPDWAATGSLYTFTVNATDPDEDDLVYSAPVLPGWLTFDPATRLLSGTPGPGDVGDASLTLRVFDGTVAVDQTVTIAVLSVAEGAEFEIGGFLRLTALSISPVGDPQPGGPVATAAFSQIEFLALPDFRFETGFSLELFQDGATYDGFRVINQTLPFDGVIGSGASQLLSFSGLALHANLTYRNNTASGSLALTASGATLFPNAPGFRMTAEDGGDGGDALVGTFNLVTGAITFAVESLRLSVGEALTVTATNASLNFNPKGPADALLAELGNVAFSFPSLGGASATIDQLNIRRNGFSIASGEVTTATVAMGGFLELSNPALTFENIHYTFGGSLAGAIGVRTNLAELTIVTELTVRIQDGPDEGSDAVVGKFDLTTRTFSLTADQLELSIPRVLAATGSGLTIAYDPAGSESQTLLSLESFEARIIPINTTVSATGLVVRPNGFSIQNKTFALPDFTLGEFLSLAAPTLTIENLGYTSGGPLSGRLGFSAGSASLNIGSGLNATISAQGPGSSAISGGFDLATKAFALDAAELSLDIPGLLTSRASGLRISYDPEGPQTQTLLQLTSFDAHVIPLNVTARLEMLTIRQNGFSLRDMTVELPDLTLGDFFTITNPAIEFFGVGYSAGSSLRFGGIRITAQTASLFPDRPFSASITNNPATALPGVSGTLNLSTGAFLLELDQFALDVGTVLAARASGVMISYDPAGPEVQTLATITSGSLNFPMFDLTGSVTDLEIRTNGFKFGSATISTSSAVSIENIFEFSGLSITVTNFGVDYSRGASLEGAITVAAQSMRVFPGSTLFSASATTISGTLDHTGGTFRGVSVTAGEVGIEVASILKFDATHVALNSNPGPGEYLAKLDTVSVELPSLGFTGSGGKFAIDRGGTFVTLPGFNVALSVGAGTMGSLMWPEWLPIEITRLELSWKDFAKNPAGFRITLSASVATSELLPLTMSGAVEGAVFDVDLLLKGKFPIVEVREVSISVEGNLFGGFVQGGLFLGIMKADALGVEIAVNDDDTRVAHSVLYGGIMGAFNVNGMGLEIRIGISELGPLNVYVSSGTPILLDYHTGLSLTNFRAGVSFHSTLPSVTDPEKLRGSAFKPTGELEFDEWKEQLKQSVRNQIQTNPGGDFWGAFLAHMKIEGGATLYSTHASTATFRADADVILSTDGKILLNARLVYGDTLRQRAILYADLSQVNEGSVSFLALIDQPAEYPVLTLRGALTMSFARADGTAVSETNLADSLEMGIRGGIDVQALNLARLTIEGEMVIRFSPLPFPTQFDIEVEGELYVVLLGQRVSLAGAAGVLRLELAEDDVKLWGALVITSNLEFLQPLGIDVSASTVFRLNLTDTLRYETINVPGRVQPLEVDLQAASYSLLLEGFLVMRFAGQDWFRMEGSFGMEISGDDELSVFAQGRLIMAPSLNLFAFNFQGFLQLSSRGLAAKLDVGLDSQLPSQYGLNLSGAFTLILNTTSQDVTYTLPSSIISIPGMAQSRTIAIPRGPPGEAARPYLQIIGNGTLTVFSMFVVRGQFSLLISPHGLDLEASGIMELRAGSTTVFSYNLDGRFRVDSTGAAAAIGLTPSPGVLNNLGISHWPNVRLEFNTTGRVQTIAGIRLEARHYARLLTQGGVNVAGMALQGTSEITVDGDAVIVQLRTSLSLAGHGIDVGGTLHISESGVAGVIPIIFRPAGFTSVDFRLEVNTTSRNITIGGVHLEAGFYSRINGSGRLEAGGLALIGSFKLSQGPGFVRVEAAAILDLKAGSATLLSFDVEGELRLYNDGLAAELIVSPRSGLPAGLGYSLDLNYRIEINTTNSPKAPSGSAIAPNTARVIGSGALQITGSFRLSGSFVFTVSPSAVMVRATAAMSLFGASTTVHGEFSLFSNGLAARIALGETRIARNIGTGAEFHLSGAFVLEVNTTPGQVFDIPGRTAVVKVTNVRLSLANLISLSGSIRIGMVDGSELIEIPQNDPMIVSIFGFNVRFSGFVRSNGTFSLTGSVAASFGRNDLVGISGTLGFTVANTGANPVMTARLTGDVYMLNTRVGSTDMSTRDSSFAGTISFNASVNNVLRVNGSGRLTVSGASRSVEMVFSGSGRLFDRINLAVEGSLNSSGPYHLVGFGGFSMGNNNLGLNGNVLVTMANHPMTANFQGVDYWVESGFHARIWGSVWAKIEILGVGVKASQGFDFRAGSDGSFSVRVEASINFPEPIGRKSVGKTVHVDLTNGFNISLSDIAHATVFLDLNRNGTHDEGEPLTVTDASGFFSFGGLEHSSPQGSPLGLLAIYDRNGDGVLEDGVEGRFMVTGGRSVATDELLAGPVVLEGGSVAGVAPYAGATVFFDANLDGQLDEDEVSVITDASGHYSFLPMRFRHPMGSIAEFDLNGNGVLDIEEGRLRVLGGTITDPETGQIRPGDGPLEGQWLAGLVPVDNAQLIYLDVNGNGIFDPGEPGVVPDEDGFYSFVDLEGTGIADLGALKPFDRNNNGVIDADEGEFVLLGGMDTNTGLPNTQVIRISARDYGQGIQFTASPLTNLLHSLESLGASAVEGNAAIQAALGLPAHINVAFFDPRAVDSSNDPYFPSILAGSQKLTVLLLTGSAAFNFGQAEAGTALSRELAKLIQGLRLEETPRVEGGLLVHAQQYDLSDPARVRLVLANAANAMNAIFTDAQLDAMSSIIAALNQQVDAIAAADSVADLISRLASVKAISQTSAADAVRAIATGAGNLPALVAEFQGEALSSKLAGFDRLPFIARLPETTSDGTVSRVGVRVENPNGPVENLVLKVSSDNPVLLKPEGIRLEGSGNDRILVLTPESGRSGLANVTVTAEVQARDGRTLVRTETFRFMVETVNTPPEVAELADMTIRANESTPPILLHLADLEIDADDLEVTVTTTDEALLPASGITIGGAGADRFLVLTPAPDFGGVAGVTVTVSDGVNQTSRSFLLTVLERNDAPVVEMLPQPAFVDSSSGPGLVLRVPEGSRNQVMVIHVSDREWAAETLLISFRAEDDSMLGQGSFVLDGFGTERKLTLTPAPGYFGTTQVELSVSDGVNTTIRSFLVMVTPVNAAPVIEPIEDRLVQRGGMIEIPVRFTDDKTPPGQVTLSAVAADPTLVSGLSFTGAGSERVLVLAAAGNQAGRTLIIVTASDGEMASSTSFEITVDGANAAPQIAQIANQIIHPGSSSGLIRIFISDRETLATELVLSASSSNASLVKSEGLALDGFGAHRTLVITPEPGKTGQTTITLTLSDGELTSTREFLVSVESMDLQIVSWASSASHGRQVGEVSLLIPDDGSFTEPRLGGVSRILIRFNQAIDPTSFRANQIFLGAIDGDGQSVDMASITWSASLSDNNTVGVISFNQKLPDQIRYRITLSTVSTPGGGTLIGDRDRVFTALLGDVNGDGKVDDLDSELIRSERRPGLIDPASTIQVRADVNGDGRVNNSDLGGVSRLPQADQRNIPDPAPPPHVLPHHVIRPPSGDIMILDFSRFTNASSKPPVLQTTRIPLTTLTTAQAIKPGGEWWRLDSARAQSR